jgi:hypothetical protein
MEIDPQHDEVDRGSPRALTSNDHINTGESGGSSVATGMPPVSSFEDIFGAEGYNMSQWRDFNTNLPDMTYRSADQARADFLMPCNNFNSAYNAHDAHPPTSFGASSSYPSSIIGVDFNSVGDASDVQPLKVDLSPSTLVGLPDRAVNVSEFDTITDSVWSLEVRNLPPLSDVQSSVCSPETYSSGPYTPNDLEDDAYFGGHELHPVRAVAKVDNDYADAFNSRPPLRHCLPPTMPHAIQHPQALSAWSIAGGLEYATNTFSGASFDTHTAPTSSLPDTGSLQDVEGQAPAAVEDTSDESDDEDSDSTPDVNELAINEATHRRERDRYLLKKRAEGYSYREIKRMGKFREAESTLRGRVRVLTKDKSERVRRPEWNQQDVSIKHAVSHMLRLNLADLVSLPD